MNIKPSLTIMNPEKQRVGIMGENEIHNGNAERCIREKPKVDETTLSERIFGDHHYVFESELVGPNLANASNIHKKTDVFTNSISTSGSAETSFKLNDMDYLIKAKFRGLDIEKRKDGNSEMVPYDSEEYQELSQVYQSIYKDFSDSAKCKD
ncbi:MAG: hypothetical protein K2X81_06930 [Candidatus Obscuribacterales bacterium]|nr:hypothetical protein [Candidatus Obscuribacterales bacterium]